MTEQHSWKQEEDKEGIAMKFENKVAIITGSTRGIGRATAELFAKEGAKVIVVGTKEELGESCVNEIKAAGGEAIFCKTDVTSDESLVRNRKANWKRTRSQWMNGTLFLQQISQHHLFFARN